LRVPISLQKKNKYQITILNKSSLCMYVDKFSIAAKLWQRKVQER
jgi:hypothetical protein